MNTEAAVGAGRSLLRQVVWPTVGMLAAMALLIGLGSWQLQRKTWKEGLIARISARVAAEPISLTAAMEQWRRTRDVEYLRVRARGRFWHDREMALYWPAETGPGWQIFTPLEVPGQGVVIVDRGFVPEALKAPETRKAGLIGAESEVVGLVRMAGGKGAFVPANEPAKNFWYWRDLRSMVAAALAPRPAGAGPGGAAKRGGAGSGAAVGSAALAPGSLPPCPEAGVGGAPSAETRAPANEAPSAAGTRPLAAEPAQAGATTRQSAGSAAPSQSGATVMQPGATPKQSGGSMKQAIEVRSAEPTAEAESASQLRAGCSPWLPFFLDAEASPANPGGWPKGGATLLDLPNRHLEYTLTWYGLAVALAGVYAAFIRRRLVGAQPAGTDPDAAD